MLFCLFHAIFIIVQEPNTEFSELTKGSIPLRLKVLPLTQKYQTEQKDFDSKMLDRRLHVYSAQITSLQLNQVTLQPEFDLNNVTCIYTSILVVSCSVILEEI